MKQAWPLFRNREPKSRDDMVNDDPYITMPFPTSLWDRRERATVDAMNTSAINAGLLGHYLKASFLVIVLECSFKQFFRSGRATCIMLQLFQTCFNDVANMAFFSVGDYIYKKYSSDKKQR
ncbi:hypothetical protein L2719_05335 [Shewanella schlegeliana]|uniref:Uncharacterized protein n=1 Tax=Shewanella schlegeliana TaxID=190308 RepID=A0ABS1SWL0_9GAMM|nr:hypothetical protein [Shewanella schlegeliana]MBL4912933.1 hypothetical protein [Shewanella schlegeliana]MCL1108971.1 hypothetical protein [Shewanella schlegeliana]GIU23495.1 hypothetical protein TUM4433_06040 [Shewanella schlegeliana]